MNEHAHTMARNHLTIETSTIHYRHLISSLFSPPPLHRLHQLSPYAQHTTHTHSLVRVEGDARHGADALAQETFVVLDHVQLLPFKIRDFDALVLHAPASTLLSRFLVDAA